MPSAPKAPPPINPTATAQSGLAYNQQAASSQQDLNAINQSNQYGSLNFQRDASGKVIGANTQLSPEQQQILNTLQGNQMGIGGTEASAINNTFGQYEGDPNLVGQAGSLTNQALAAQMPAWERFDAPARDQQRTQLINQGLQEGSPAYQQQMDKLIQQQDLNRGQWLANFQPQAFQEATTQYQLPLQNVAAMQQLSQPADFKSQLINTPQTNVAPVDYGSMAKTSQEEAFKNYQQQVARQNMFMNMGLGVAGNALSMPVNPMNPTYGSNMMQGMFG